jgi:hypothetical protein
MGTLVGRIKPEENPVLLYGETVSKILFRGARIYPVVLLLGFEDHFLFKIVHTLPLPGVSLSSSAFSRIGFRYLRA